MKYLSLILLFSVLFALLLLLPSMESIWTRWTARTTHSPPEAVIVREIQTIRQLQDLGDLVVLKVCVADVIEIRGHGFTGVYLVKGDGLIAVNFRQTALINSDESTRSLTIRLPSPSVIQPRIDHEQTKTYDYKKQVWFGGDKDALRDESMKLAQRQIQMACHSPEHIERAKQNCELLIKMLYRLVDWDVAVEWEAFQ
ncbi:DUF4230 domain-containing protein [Lacunimicrobium album]